MQTNISKTTSQPMAVNLAHACLSRLARKEPKTGAGYKLEKSDFSYDQPNGKHHRSKNIYRLACGTICTLAEAAAQLGLTESRTTVLFTRYCNRYTVIHKNHGVNAQGNKIKTADGKPSTLKDLSAIYGYSEASISRHFSKANGDYIEANKKLKELAANRAAADKRALERMRARNELK